MKSTLGEDVWNERSKRKKELLEIIRGGWKSWSQVATYEVITGIIFLILTIAHAMLYKIDLEIIVFLCYVTVCLSSFYTIGAHLMQRQFKALVDYLEDRGILQEELEK